METNPDAHLRRLSREVPHFWRDYDRFRSMRGRDLPDWPQWCYCPLAGAYAIVSGGGDNRVPHDRLRLVGELACMAAWRPTKGIYRFDPDLALEILETPITGELPREHLYTLPEWCVYVDTQSVLQMRGFFAFLEHDDGDGRTELRIYLDKSDDELTPIILHLVGGGIAEALRAFANEANAQHALHSRPTLAFPPLLTDKELRSLAVVASQAVSLLLYLCADEPDYDGGSPPSHPRHIRGRVMGAQQTRVWGVGARIGSALRAARARSMDSESHGSGHAGPRAHVRRAHWHSYWTGHRGEQSRVLRWISPVLVGASEIVTTIHPVG